MIAEAMRLSLLEEEERQRKEREEKEKGKNKEGASSDQPEASTSGAGPSTAGAGSPTPSSTINSTTTTTSTSSSSDLHLPAVTGTSLLPPAAGSTPSLDTSAEERGRSGHRPSSSISSLQAPSPVIPQSGAARARSQPPLSALAAGLRSAVSAASAVATPTGRASPVPSRSGARTPVANASSSTPPVAPSPPAPVAVPTITTSAPVIPALEVTPPLGLISSSPTEVSPSLAAPAPAVPASAAATEPLGSSRPIPSHAQSFASSVWSVDSEAEANDTYDVLASDDETDSIAEPLIARSETPIARHD
jgi:hypothetical protein